MFFRFSMINGERDKIRGLDVHRVSCTIGYIISISILCMLLLGMTNELFAQEPGPPGRQRGGGGGGPQGQPSASDMRVVERGQDGKASKISFFNVVNVNIHDILKFMSDETNLTIIASDRVQGKVTLVNLKGITVDEALEALKTALNTLGFTMVRVNRTIVIIPISDAKTRPLRVQIGSDPKMIDSSDEMITQIIPLSSADAGEMAQNLKNLIPKEADMFADTTTNSLVITDTSSNIRRIALILKQLDTEPTGILQTKIFQLKHANATNLAQTLDNMFRQGVETARAFQKMAKRGADEMMKTLERARQEGRLPTRGIDVVKGQVLIIGEERTNKLIVTASDENMEIIAKLIEELDTSDIAQSEIKVFLLNYGVAQDVASELETLLQGSGGRNLPPWERWRARELQTTTKGIQGNVNITSDQRLNAVIVSSDPQNFPIIEDIIKQLDQQVEPQEIIKIIPLKYADAETTVTNLQELFQEGGTGSSNMPWWERERRRFDRQMRGESENITGIRGTVNLVADTRLNAIIVSTAAANIPILEDLIGKIDIIIPDMETDTRIFELKHADAESIAEIINNTYQSSGSRGRGGFDFMWWMPRSSRGSSQRSGAITGSISVEAYTRTNSLIVTTTSARNFEIVSKLIEQLDQPTPADYKYSTMIYPLEYSNAEDMQQLLTDVFSEEGGGISRQRGGGMNFFRMMMTGRTQVPRDVATLMGQVKINADSQTNSLIITTPERNHDAVRDIIQQLDISRGQVWMEIKVLEVSLGEENKLGIEWSWKEGSHLGKEGLNAVFGTDFQMSDDKIGFSYKIFNKNLNALLHTLMKENKVEVLSLPSILTRDNQQTTLSRGKDIPYLESARTDQFGQVIYDYNFLQDIGINLRITPHISKYGTRSKILKEGEKRTIGLEIEEINVSSFLEYTDFNAPVTADSTISTYVDVEDGSQVAIGGMIKKETKKVHHKFPILGSIPFIGSLFNKTEDVVENTQLWVLITPHIIDIKKPEDRETLRNLQEEQRKQMEMKMNQSGVQQKTNNEK